jgi:hypothetical protein
MESAPALKYCPCCFTAKVPEAFSPDRRNKDQLNYRCKKCQALHFRLKYLQNPEPFRAAVRKYRESLKNDHSS